MAKTHDVFNQVPPLGDDDPFANDLALAEGVRREGGSWGLDRIEAFSTLVGSHAVRKLGRDANRFTPILHSHDRTGHRIDEVEFHPAWHELMRLGMAHAVHALPWRERQPGAHVVRAALFQLLNHAENGVCCPLTMTFAAAPALAVDSTLGPLWLPRLEGLEYDPRRLAPQLKSSCTVGMAMTEKQGGSDVRANRTTATDAGDGWWQLTGHKWFCSAPQSDAFLTLAQVAEAGLTCFLVARILPDGRPNNFAIQRLKDKLGNRSNASAEIEYDGTLAHMVGQPGRGIATIMEMVQHTRLDCAVGSTGIVRAALAEALHHAAHRFTFGRRLSEHAGMVAVLADLQLEAEGATVLALRLARAFDGADSGDLVEGAFARIATAIAKYWICKRCPMAVAEALECLGGNGYVEESLLPRLYREAPLSSIWEGSGNVMCLDVLRTIERHPESVEALLAELELARGAAASLDRAIDTCAEMLRPSESRQPERHARRVVEHLAITLTACLLARHAPACIADGYRAARLDDPGLAFGALPTGVDAQAILKRAAPAAFGP